VQAVTRVAWDGLKTGCSGLSSGLASADGLLTEGLYFTADTIAAWARTSWRLVVKAYTAIESCLGGVCASPEPNRSRNLDPHPDSNPDLGPGPDSPTPSTGVRGARPCVARLRPLLGALCAAAHGCLLRDAWAGGQRHRQCRRPRGGRGATRTRRARTLTRRPSFYPATSHPALQPKPQHPNTPTPSPTLHPTLHQVSAGCEAFGAGCDWLGEHVLWPLYRALGKAVGAVYAALSAALSWIGARVLAPLCGALASAAAATGRALGAACPNLQLLALAQCPRVSDEGVCALLAAACRAAGGAPRLRTLLLACCPGISDRTLRAVAELCPSLLGLHVAGCVGVRDSGLRAVAARCATLQYVDVSGCPAVTRDGVHALRTGCRAIKKLVT